MPNNQTNNEQVAGNTFAAVSSSLLNPVNSVLVAPESENLSTSIVLPPSAENNNAEPDYPFSDSYKSEELTTIWMFFMKTLSEKFIIENNLVISGITVLSIFNVWSDWYKYQIQKEKEAFSKTPLTHNENITELNKEDKARENTYFLRASVSTLYWLSMTTVFLLAVVFAVVSASLFFTCAFIGCMTQSIFNFGLAIREFSQGEKREGFKYLSKAGWWAASGMIIALGVGVLGSFAVPVVNAVTIPALGTTLAPIVGGFIVSIALSITLSASIWLGKTLWPKADKASENTIHYSEKKMDTERGHWTMRLLKDVRNSFTESVTHIKKSIFSVLGFDSPTIHDNNAGYQPVSPSSSEGRPSEESIDPNNIIEFNTEAPPSPTDAQNGTNDDDIIASNQRENSTASTTSQQWCSSFPQGKNAISSTASTDRTEEDQVAKNFSPHPPCRAPSPEGEAPRSIFCGI